MSLSRAVTMRIGRSEAARSSLHTAKPSRPGNPRSSTTRSGACALQMLDDAIAAVLDHDPETVALQIRAHQLREAQIVFDQQDERLGVHVGR